MGSSVLNNDQHSELGSLFNWSRTIWEGLLAYSHLRYIIADNNFFINIQLIPSFSCALHHGRTFLILSQQ